MALEGGLGSTLAGGNLHTALPWVPFNPAFDSLEICRGLNHKLWSWINGKAETRCWGGFLPAGGGITSGKHSHILFAHCTDACPFPPRPLYSSYSLHSSPHLGPILPAFYLQRTIYLAQISSRHGTKATPDSCFLLLASQYQSFTYSIYFIHFILRN